MNEDENPLTAGQFGSRHRETDVPVHQCGTEAQSSEMMGTFARLLEDVHARYGAPGPETEGEARERVDTFIANHLTWGDLVFERRVAISLITDGKLMALHGEVVALFNAIAAHSSSITQTSSCTVDEDKRYVFAARPFHERRLFRKNRRGPCIVELALAAGFTQIEPIRRQSQRNT